MSLRAGYGASDRALENFWNSGEIRICIFQHTAQGIRRWAGHVARVGGGFGRETERKRPVGKPSCELG